MSFFCLQRAVDLLLLFVLWDKFGTCVSCFELFDRFRTLDALSQIGTIAVMVIVVASLGETILRALNYLLVTSK